MRPGWVSFGLWGRGAFCVSAAVLLCVDSSAAAQRGSSSGAWQRAVEARAGFEAEPAGEHTKAEYSAVMDNFRAIYHGDPQDAHAPRAIEQVAELLGEQGRELGDAKSLKSAAGQYEFLAKAYPAYARRARAAEEQLEEQVSAARFQVAGSDRNADAVDAPPSAGGVGRNGTNLRSRVAAVTAMAAVTPVAAVAAVHDASEDAAPVVQVTDVRRVDEVAAPLNPKRPMADVTAIRHWSTATYTRVAIDLGDEVEYQAARVEHPDRIYFDLHHARLAQELVGKSFAVTDDGFLTKIRAAQYSGDVTRVVLDVHEVGEYSAFLLPNPYRLIIDIHGKAANSEQQTANSEHQTANSADRVDAAAAAPSASAKSTAPQISAKRGAEVSGLPPMPVTDGSNGFGLPTKSVAPGAPASGTVNESVAQPRVVIPQKATAARPVPNTVSSRGVNTGSEVAAVSQQQGRVEATSKPTSQPIVSRSSKQQLANSEQTGDVVPRRTGRGKATAVAVAHVDGEPVEAAPPTADGKTSLVRALGLKIGRIVIDAGHGGHDSGTLGVDGIEEKDVVLDVALRLGKLLHDRLGAEIVYTRADDTFIPLETRTAIANKAQADLFISIHANSSSDASARGVEVYYLNFTSDPEAMKVAGRENAVSTQSVHELSDLVKKIALKDKIDESKELATDVDDALFAGITKGNAGLKNRGVKKAPFVVLIGANMPSILAEISFVTNPDDAAELQRPAYRERVAESLFNGVAQYAGGINGKKGAKATERAAR